MIPFGNLKRHYELHKKEIDEAVSRVLASGWYILGKELEVFEKSFSEYCSAKYGVGVASGTEAIQIALNACEIGQGDEVLTVSNTCVPTITGIEAAGAKPIFADIDPATYTMDPSLIEQRISKRCKALVAVHLYGQCADMKPTLAIAKKYGLKVIEDCAQAHGAEYRNKKAGTLGDISAFSFYPSKNLGAVGDAGMVVTNNTVLARRAQMLRNYGQKKPNVHLIKGINTRMDELQAAILNTKLSYLDNLNKRRREIAKYYIDRLTSFNVVLPEEAFGRKHIYHLFVIRVNSRKRFMAKMMIQSVQTAIHYPIPIHLQPAYSEYKKQGRYLRVTEELAGQLVSLPIYPELTDSEVEHVALSAAKVLSTNKKIK